MRTASPAALVLLALSCAMVGPSCAGSATDVSEANDGDGAPVAWTDKEPAPADPGPQIGKPRPALGDWACRIRIQGIPKGRADVSGVDPLQALQLAILHARRMLDASGLSLVWGDDGAPGDVGIPMSVPTGYGFAFQRKLEPYLERESTRFDEAVATFLKEKERLRASKERRRAGAGSP